jgi:hypothetical protein
LAEREPNEVEHRMTDGISLVDRVLDALEADPDVAVVAALPIGAYTFVFGSRDTRGQTWGTMMFVIALEDERQPMDQRDHERLRKLKEKMSVRSTNQGTAWYGVASTVETAVRISKGEAQREPPNAT